MASSRPALTPSLLTLALIIPSLTSCAPRGPAAGGQSQETEIVEKVTELRTQRITAENYVIRAKQIKQAPTQLEARKLFDDARAKNNAYIESFLDALRRGSNVDLQSTAKLAVDSAAAFSAFVDKNTEARAGASAGTVIKIFEIGNAILDYMRKQDEAKRKRMADDLATQLAWQPWDKITG